MDPAEYPFIGLSRSNLQSSLPCSVSYRLTFTDSVKGSPAFCSDYVQLMRSTYKVRGREKSEVEMFIPRLALWGLLPGWWLF